MSENRAINLASYVRDAALMHPHNIAVKMEHRGLSYLEFDALIARFCCFLRRQQAESMLPADAPFNVSILAFKTIDALALCQAALRLGGSYTVIDPRYPEQRIRDILRDSQPMVLLSDQIFEQLARYADELANTKLINTDCSGADESVFCLEYIHTLPPDTTPIRDPEHDRVAFVLYTSGSTGVPKGVRITHANAAYSIDWAHEQFAFGADEVFLNQAHMGFDFCVLDYYNAWKAGALVVLVPEYTAVFSSEVVNIIKREEVTNLWLVPSNVISLIENGGLLNIEPGHIRRFLYAGEPFPVNYLKKISAWLGDIDIYNLYGPCETNLLTYHQVQEEDLLGTDIPIGKVLPGTRVKLLTESGKIIESGRGELIASSPSVFSGYSNSDKSPDTYFVTHESISWYRTGDVSTIDDQGVVRYVGRTDSMVKIRGYRVELPEIECAFNSHPSVQRSVALAHKACANDSYELYVFCVVGSPCENIELERFVGKKLPAYMLPKKTIIVGGIPFNDRGKIDKEKLLGELV